jgi:ATP-binding cassette, subfamily C, bacterial LapB
MKTTNDSLLSCLETLSQILGRPTSRGAILAGLPIVDEQITVDMFPRAASHLDLQARLKKITLKNKAFHLPIPLVLLLKDNDACLLTDITDHGTAKIIHPPGTTTNEVSFNELMSVYTGQAFVVEPDARFVAESAHVSTDLGGKSWFWNPVNRLWSTYSEVIIASLLINLFALAVPLFTMNVYDRVIPNRIFDTLWVLATGILIIFVFDAIMRVLRSYFIDQAGKLVDLQVSATILERILGIRMVDRPRSVGAFANTVESFNSAREFITSSTVTVLVDLPFSLLFLLIIAIIGGSLVFVPLVLIPVSILFGYLLQRPLTKYTKIAQRYSAEKQAILYETLSGIESVKTSGAEPIMQNKWEQATNLAAQVGIKLRFLANAGIFFSTFIQQLAVVLVIIVGVYLISNNDLTLGGLIACSILSSRALAPMAQLSAIFTRYHQTKGSLESLDKIMNLPVESPSGRTALTVPDLKGTIELRNVSFQFPNTGMPVLSNINLKVAPGEHVGIIGRVGSGKTTLAKMLVGLLQPTDGTIIFDEVDQNHYDIADLRKKIGYVPQDVMLFHGSLHDNLVFGSPNADDKDILRAIEITGIEQFVKSKLGSYEAQIVEGGKNLSGGQRQIIAIARSLLLNPQIFLYDEPTNSMDNNTEMTIKEKLATYLQGKTLILLTHRPSLLTLVSRVIVMDNGKIVADGPKDAVLLALSEGKITIPKA